MDPVHTPVTHEPPSRGVAAAYARAVVRLRWWILLGWLAVATVSATLLPAVGHTDSGVEGFVSANSPAITTEVRSYQIFGFPLLSRVAVVQRDPSGLSPYTQAEAVLRAASVTRGEYHDIYPIVGAIPVPNTFGAFPGSRERGTTVITLLFMPPWVGFADQYEAAQRFARLHYEPDDKVVGVTGSIPARAEQARLVADSMSGVEAATLLAVLVIVAAAFRSLLAPVLTLAVAGVAILMTLHVAASVGRLIGVAVPAEVEPLLVALLLGVVTDYVVFYLSGLRHWLAAGRTRLDAATRATARFTPIVAAAGVTVACGTGALLVARSAVFRAFGPGMALAVAVGLVVAVTLVPALLALLGRAAFWPSRPGRARARTSGALRIRRSGGAWQRRRITWLTRPRTAAVVLGGCVAGLLLATLPLRHLDLGLSFIPSLPPGDSVRKAAQQAQAGFSDGILSPTVLLVQSPGITSRRAALDRLQSGLAGRPGVAGVLGPTDQVAPTELGLVLSRDGSAARYLIVLDDDPLGARAIDTLAGLRRDLPGLLRAAGLPGVRASFAGDTAIAETVVSETRSDLARITFAALAVNFLLLAIFLRALVAPLYLLASSVLALTATLGLTTLIFQGLLGHDGLTFYVPFSVAVLLVSLGSDYNIFGIGHVWAEARHRPLRHAMISAFPQSARAITTAGITLAVSFGLLALVPLRAFREIALAMSTGILIDALIVRSLVVPSLLTLVGSVSGWPGGQLRAGGKAEPEVEPGMERTPV